MNADADFDAYLAGITVEGAPCPPGASAEPDGEDGAGEDFEPQAAGGGVGTLLSIEGAAREIGCSRETLRRGLRELGLETAKGTLFPLRQIFRALHSDGKAERTRLDRERADALALERRKNERELLPRGEVVDFVTSILLPVRQQVLELPSQMAGRVNTADPEHARRVLSDWGDEFLAQLRACVETAMQGKTQ